MKVPIQQVFSNWFIMVGICSDNVLVASPGEEPPLLHESFYTLMINQLAVPERSSDLSYSV